MFNKSKLLSTNLKSSINAKQALNKFQERTLKRSKWPTLRKFTPEVNHVTPRDYEADKRYRSHLRYVEPTDYIGYPPFKVDETNLKLDQDKKPEEIEEELLQLIDKNFEEEDKFNSRTSEDRLTEQFKNYLEANKKSYGDLNAATRVRFGTIVRSGTAIFSSAILRSLFFNLLFIIIIFIF